jgi:cyclopropane-fatty-acyl-phospholipid synthase
MDLIRATTQLFSGDSREFPVRLWDGTVLNAERPTALRATLVLTSPRALDAILPPVSERKLSEAYLDGDLELEGDAIGLLEAALRWTGPPASPGLLPALGSVLIRRWLARFGKKDIDAHLHGRTHSVNRDRAAVQHHYDVSNDFYRLFLDEAMVYSCAHFTPDVRSLEEAQRAKLDLVCRKLSLSQGDRLLDVGCGWGALVSHALTRYGATAVGITLSQNQLAEAKRRVAQGPPGATILGVDYRELPAGERFHKISSIGMMEHVGRARLGEYFKTLYRLLHPGGLFLNHAIADTSAETPAFRWASRRGGSFIDRYIFPDGELLPIATVLQEAERAGFEVRDVDSLREHYAETLTHWLERFERSQAQAEQMVGRRRTRAYRLYLAASAALFRAGRISIFQALLAKPDEAGRVHGVPRWRGEWYERQAAVLEGLSQPAQTGSR